MTVRHTEHGVEITSENPATPRDGHNAIHIADALTKAMAMACSTVYSEADTSNLPEEAKAALKAAQEKVGDDHEMVALDTRMLCMVSSKIAVNAINLVNNETVKAAYLADMLTGILMCSGLDTVTQTHAMQQALMRAHSGDKN